MNVRTRYVLTVDRDGERLEEFLAQRDAHRFEVVDGVDLRGLAAATVAAQLDHDTLQRRYGRTLAAGEAGCTLSHRMLMEMIAVNDDLHDDDVALVVEDDAVLHPELETVLPWLASQPFDVMPLHHGSANRLGVDGVDGDRLMDRLYPLSPLSRHHEGGAFRVGLTTPESWMLTVGYLVRKRAARHLSSHERGPVDRVADDYRVLSDLGLRVCQVRPSLVWESPNQVSVITGSGRTLGNLQEGEAEIAHRMLAQAASSQLRWRKLAWLLGRDATSRLPWWIRHCLTVDGVRATWNRGVLRMPERARHLVRPGTR